MECTDLNPKVSSVLLKVCTSTKKASFQLIKIKHSLEVFGFFKKNP